MSSKIADDFATLMAEDGRSERKYSFAYGTVKKSGSDVTVKFDGSDIYTPVETSTELNDGDRVEVMIKNHRAVVTSNFTSKSVGTTRFDSFETKTNDDITEVKKTQQDSSTDYKDFKAAQEEFRKNQNDFNAARSEFERFQKNFNSARSAFEMAQADFNQSTTTEINNIKTNYVQTTYLESYYTKTEFLETTYAKTDYLEGNFVKTKDLEATYVKTKDLEASYVKTSYLTANYMTAKSLEATYVKTKDLEAKYASIDYLTSGSASFIGDVSAVNLKVYGALKLGMLTGEKMLNAMERTVVGIDSLISNDGCAIGNNTLACELRGKPLFLRNGSNYIVFEQKAFRPCLGNGNYIALGSSDEQKGLDGSVNRRCRWGTLYTTQSPNVSSLATMKENIRPLKSALNDVLNTDVFSYNLKTDLEEGVHSKKYGFVIGAGYKISDKVMHSTKDGIDLYNACGLAFRAIQELYEMIQNEKRTVK